MSEPITLNNQEYIFQRIDDRLTLKCSLESYKQHVNDSAVWALFDYTLALQATLADMTCTCGYILPSKNANNPEAHKIDCPFRLKVEELKNE